MPNDLSDSASSNSTCTDLRKRAIIAAEARQMEEDGSPPLCTSCSHHHHLGQKCPICGHTGKGKAYLLIPKTTAPSSNTLHFECFDKRGDANVYKTQWALARILRNRVFVEECQIPEEQEFDTHEDSCRHILGLVGDAPVMYARWRIEEGDGMRAVIDRMVVLKSHRGRGYSNHSLDFMLQDIEAMGREMQRLVAGIIVTVPVDLPAMADKLRSRRGFEVIGGTYTDRGGNQFVRMLLRNQAPTH